MYSVTIQAAYYDGREYPDHPAVSRFMIWGHVSSTEEKGHKSAITIIVDVPKSDPIIVVTGQTTIPPDKEDDPADFSFFGPIPGLLENLPEGASVTVYCNELKHDTKEIVVIDGGK